MTDETLDQFDFEGARQASLPSSPQLVGYQLRQQLGEGSFGSVWEGVQLSTGQAVAIKVLRASFRSLERELLRLRQVAEHPYVVNLLDANLQHQPPFLVMPLLSQSLARVEAVPLEQIVTWFEQAASALHYIHSRGLLHCDLKPANLLLDSHQNLRVADFGQALLQDEAEGKLGTLFYMPAEQAMGDPAPVPNVSWDIYALGATFYHLLCRRLPRENQQLRDSLQDSSESLKVLTTYHRQLWDTPLQKVRALNPGVDPELASIVEHCLESRPEDRYPDMGSILADLERRRHHRPLRCRKPTPSYLAERFFKRHSLSVAIAALAGLLLVGGTVVSYREILSQRNQARLQAYQARETLAQTYFQQAARSQGSEALFHLARALECSPESPQAWLRSLALHLHLQTTPQLVSQRVFNESPIEALQLPNLPDWAVTDHFLSHNLLLPGKLETPLARALPGNLGLHLSQEGSTVALRQPNGIQLFHRGEAGSFIARPQARWFRLDPAGDQLVVVNPGRPEGRELEVFRGGARTSSARLPLAYSWTQSTISQDGRWLAGGGPNLGLECLQLSPLRRSFVHSDWTDFEQIAFDADSSQLQVLRSGGLLLLDPQSGRTLEQLHPLPEGTGNFAVASKKSWVALGSPRGWVRLFGQGLKYPYAQVHCGQSVAWVGLQEDQLLALAAPPDDPEQGTFWTWQLPERGQTPVPGGYCYAGEEFILFGDSRQCKVLDPKSHPQWLTLERPLPAQPGQAQWVGQELWVAAESRQLLRFRRQDGKFLGEHNFPQAIRSFRPDGKAVLLSEDGRNWSEVSLKGGQVLRQTSGLPAPLEQPQYSPDGHSLVALERHRRKLHRLFADEPARYLAPKPIQHFHFDPTGKSLWISYGQAGEAGATLIFRLDDPEVCFRVPHADQVLGAQAGPKPETLLSLSRDGSAVLWDLKSQKPLKIYRGHSPLMHGRFSPDGNLLVTTSPGQARLWDVASALPLSPPLPNDDSFLPCFTAEQGLITLTEGRYRRWSLNAPDWEDPAAEVRRVTGLHPPESAWHGAEPDLLAPLKIVRSEVYEDE